MTSLTFHGATETVTGSKYLLESGAARVLVDCGLFQGLKALREMNWERPRFDPAGLDCVVLTHAHLDHIGYLPRLVRFDFRGPIYCTRATEQLARLILLDSAFNQERDAEYANRKNFSKHKPALPLYDHADVERTLKLFRTVDDSAWFTPAGPIRMRYHDAGHLLGSTMIETEVDSASGKPTRILFSGDVGRYGAPLYHDPAPPPACDYLICESTYGNRDHTPAPILNELERAVRAAIARGGVMLVAAFAVGRAQQLIYLLQVLIHQRRIPAIPIFLDSPMAVHATDIYQSHVAEHDLAEGNLGGLKNVFAGPNVLLVESAEESKKINNVTGPAVIISSAGMMTGGRILHHLRQRLPFEQNTVLLGGFMAEGTRGRQLQDRARSVRIHGREVRVRAAIDSVSALSGHAGRSELLRWLEPLDKPQQVFITHGELSSANALAGTLRATRGWDTIVPKRGETFELTGA